MSIPATQLSPPMQEVRGSIPHQLLQHFNRIAEAPDAIPRLRRFILDLAVRGKLVEQDPNDEPASELLKSIEAEKKRLVREKKIKKPKALQPINPAEVPFTAPPGWKWIRIGDTVNNHLGGGTPSKSNLDYWGGDIFWASVKDVGKSKYLDRTIDQITRAGLENSSSNLIEPNSLLVVTRMGLGKVSINRVPVAINQDLRALMLSSLASIDYYYVFFKTHSVEGTGLTVKGIKVDELLNFYFPLPPLAEQKRIVAKVDELMALCDQLEQAQSERERQRQRFVAATHHQLNSSDEAAPQAVQRLATELPTLTARPEDIAALRQTILNLAVRGKLVPQDPNDEPASELLKRIASEKNNLANEKKLRKTKPLTPISENEIPFALPTNWKWVRHGEIVKLWNGYAFKSHDFSEEGIPVIRIGDLVNGEVSLCSVKRIPQKIADTCAKDFYIPSGALVLAMSGATTGKTAINNAAEPVLLNQRVGRLEPHLISVRYLRFFFETIIARNLSISVGAAIPNLSAKQINETPFPLPPLAEQKRIVAKVDELMALCDRLEAQLSTTQTESQRLLEACIKEAVA